LEKIEADFRKADSELDFNACVQRNRSFVEHLLKYCAVLVANKRGENPKPEWEGPGGAGQVRAYLNSQTFLSDTLHKLCAAFYGFASDQGSHQLSTKREVARIVKNINIELALLLLRRVETFLK
ncbi:MAG: hypothetical protein WAQ52_08545, partial [Terriglobales bacterium]